MCGYSWCWLCGGLYTGYHYSPLNVFGCPNMQRDETSNSQSNAVWLFVKKWLFRITAVLLVILLIPIAIVFSGPFTAIALYSGCL